MRLRPSRQIAMIRGGLWALRLAVILTLGLLALPQARAILQGPALLFLGLIFTQPFGILPPRWEHLGNIFGRDASGCLRQGTLW